MDGIPQLPLPESLQPYTDEFLAAIDINKDVDGFNPANLGEGFTEIHVLASCAALGCLKLSAGTGDPHRVKAVLVGDS